MILKNLSHLYILFFLGLLSICSSCISSDIDNLEEYTFVAPFNEFANIAQVNTDFDKEHETVEEFKYFDFSREIDYLYEVDNDREYNYYTLLIEKNTKASDAVTSFFLNKKINNSMLDFKGEEGQREEDFFDQKPEGIDAVNVGAIVNDFEQEVGIMIQLRKGKHNYFVTFIGEMIVDKKEVFSYYCDKLNIAVGQY